MTALYLLFGEIICVWRVKELQEGLIFIVICILDKYQPVVPRTRIWQSQMNRFFFKKALIKKKNGLVNGEILAKLGLYEFMKKNRLLVSRFLRYAMI